MEVNLLTQNAFPEGSILSIRSGAVRRQAHVGSGRPFRFPQITMDSPLKFDILMPIDTAYLVLKPGEEQYKVTFCTGGESRTCEVEVRKDEGGQNAMARTNEDGLGLTAGSKDDSISSKQATDYLEKHQILQFLQVLLQMLVKEKPDNPYAYVARHVMSGYNPTDTRAPARGTRDAPDNANNPVAAEQKSVETRKEEANTAKEPVKSESDGLFDKMFEKFDKEADEVEQREDPDTEDELEIELELQDIDLDLNARVTRNEWIAIMREMDIDSADASNMYDDIASEAAQENIGNAQEGVPLREFLIELKIELEDRQALKAIAKAAANVQAKKAKGLQDEETPESATSKALLPAIDRVVRELDKTKRPADDAWAIFKEGKVALSKAHCAALQTFETKQAELNEKVKACMIDPPLLNSAAGQNACHELCAVQVSHIIESCRKEGAKFIDTQWNVQTSPNSVLYVDREKPGHDCTVAAPAAYKRLTEIIDGPVLFKGGIRAGDIIQGQIGTCFLLGAMGAVVSNNEHAIRKLFIKYDVEVGVYGVRFNMDGEWMYVIVDDLMPVDEYGRLLYARSKDPQEVWCPILEKAYCKLHTCYEMCDGGISTDAIFNFFGGVSGHLPLKQKHRQDPKSYFKILKHSRNQGWLLTVHFTPKSGASASQGKCGESTFKSGLVGGHCYSVLRVVEACGHQLICCRNPWGTGEWLGKWSDKNTDGEWTDEMKEACGYVGVNDGKFWMSIEDFVENSGGVSYARPFGPNWKKVTQYKHFQKGAMLATAQWGFAAREANELSFEKGAAIEVISLAAGWWYGKKAGGEEKGYFPGNYAELNDRPVARFDLVGTKAEDVTGPMTVVVMLMQPDVTLLRKYYTRKEDGLNYKDKSYPCLQLCIVGPDGKVHMKKEARQRCVWGELKLPGGGQWRIYAFSVDGLAGSFSIRAYVKDGTATLKEVPGANLSELQAAISAR